MDYVASRRSRIEQNGFSFTRTIGSSMRPLIWGGEHCVAVATLDGEPEVGDLLQFVIKREGEKEKSVVHRLVEIQGEGKDRVYVTRGDNCVACERVRRLDIIGKVAEVHRVSGFRPWHIIPKKQFSVKDRSYLIYSHIWTASWPARRLYYLMRAHANGLRARLFSIFRKNR